MERNEHITCIFVSSISSASCCTNSDLAIMYILPCPASEATSCPLHTNELDTFGIFSRLVPFTTIR